MTPQIVNLKAEVEDLKEKLETLKVRRAEDREKLRELERMRLQLDQANEFKAKIMESQAQLQRDLQRAKQEVCWKIYNKVRSTSCNCKI